MYKHNRNVRYSPTFGWRRRRREMPLYSAVAEAVAMEQTARGGVGLRGRYLLFSHWRR